jgi:copper chaperone CopZ
VPIAASLIAAGMPAGSALVFLMAGPATNVATMGAIYRALGIRVLGLYLGTVIVASIGLGMTFDFVLGDVSTAATGHDHGSAAWWQIGSALLLIALLIFLLGRRLPWFSAAHTSTNEVDDMDFTLKVEGMTCQHCIANVKNALESVESIQKAEPDLATGLVRVKGTIIDRAALTDILTKAGYTVVTP